jgi:hypothetical protein
LGRNPAAFFYLTLLQERGSEIDQSAGASAHKRQVNGPYRLLQDRLSGGGLCKLHQALAPPPVQMGAVEMSNPVWCSVRLRLIERGLGTFQSTEAGVGVTRDGLGFRFRAT